MLLIAAIWCPAHGRAEQSTNKGYFYRVAQALSDTAAGKQSGPVSLTEADVKNSVVTESRWTKVLRKPIGAESPGWYEIAFGTNSTQYQSY